MGSAAIDKASQPALSSASVAKPYVKTFRVSAAEQAKTDKAVSALSQACRKYGLFEAA